MDTDAHSTEGTPSSAAPSSAVGSKRARPDLDGVDHASHTLYLRNLNHSAKPTHLRRLLVELVRPYAECLQIQCARDPRTRGQAWLTFASADAAALVMGKLRGYMLLGRPIAVEWAREEAHMVDRARGRAKRQARRLPGQPPVHKSAAQSQASTAAAASGSTASVALTPAAPPAPPSPSLFVRALPRGVTTMMLSMLFRQFPGFVRVRLREGEEGGGGGVGFVDYESADQASVALAQLQGFMLAEDAPLVLSFKR
uniref:RRM domain-containing protein n=1 Tax=Sexangularia sp. CB-2014 TaxID=1486929 RepID=A0A7S1YGV8_9EUKA